MEFTELLNLRRPLSSENWCTSEYLIARCKSLESTKNRAPREKEVPATLVGIIPSSIYFPSIPPEDFSYISYKIDILPPA